jgi:FixJ family two-component response regulator
MQSLIEQVRFNESLNYLTPREREVYSFLCKGYGNFEIVKAMNIALPTAKQFKSSVMRKLGVRSLSELLKLNSRISTAEKTENILKA